MITPLVNLLVAGPGNAVVIDLIPLASRAGSHSADLGAGAGGRSGGVPEDAGVPGRGGVVYELAGSGGGLRGRVS